MEVLLREARDTDAALILAWRSIPQVFQWFYIQSRSNHLIEWDEHWAWWKTRYNLKIFIIQVNDGATTRDVGFLNISQLDHWRPEFGIGIGEVSLWGKGVGKKALQLGIAWLKNKGYRRAHASILKSNERSLSLFKSCGFKIIGDARENEIEVELWID